MSCVVECRESCPDGWFTSTAAMPRINGGTIVTWQHRDNLRFPNGSTYQLQYSYGETIDDWVSIGSPQVDVAQLTDATRRVWASLHRLRYRVHASVDGTLYYSKPIIARLGALTADERQLIGEILRREGTPAARKEQRPGIHLRRRREGVPCETCRDNFSGEVINSDCEDCYGVGWVDGYYAPNECCYVKRQAPSSRRVTLSDQESYVEELAPVRWIFYGVYGLAPLDVWIDQRTDERWQVQTVSPMVQVGSVPVLQSVEAVLLSTSHPVYRYPIPNTTTWPA